MTTAKTALADVERMLKNDVAFDEIEEYIEARAELPHEAQSALWLLAWGEVDRGERRQAVGELLEGIGHDLGRGYMRSYG